MAKHFLHPRPPLFAYLVTAWGVDQAMMMGADIVNVSYGSDCNGWCRSFSVFSGLKDVKDALHYWNDATPPAPIITGAGNDSWNLDSNDRFVVPCEISGGVSVCVGGLTSSGTKWSDSNFGANIDAWAPSRSLVVGPTPSNPQTQRFSGTSAAAPYLSGVVATALHLHGEALTNNDVINRFRSSAQPSTDGNVPGVLDYYQFIHPYAEILPDTYEPNDHEWQANAQTPVNELLTFHGEGSGIPDQDWFSVTGIPGCGSVTFDVEFLPDAVFGEPEMSNSNTLNWQPGDDIGDNLRRFSISGIALPWIQVGLRSSGGGTTGYTIRNLQLDNNPFPLGEGPNYSNTCNGRDDDCDGEVDEGFPDTDSDGQADCIDRDDDNDCVQDANDNCPLTVNAHQFCPMADNPDAQTPNAFSGCGDRSCNDPVDKDAFAGFGLTIAECFGAVPIEPKCFIDGCLDPGPLMFSEIKQVILNAQELVGHVPPLSHKDELFRREFEIVNDIQFRSDHLVKLPMSFWNGKPLTDLPRIGFKPRRVNAPIARNMRLEDIEACRPLKVFGQEIEQMLIDTKTANCWRRVRAGECQLDSDGDGIGDACDSSP